MGKRVVIWQPIQDLPDNWQSMSAPELPMLKRLWDERRQELQDSTVYQTFLTEMNREIAIETGIIERLYTLERGITEILIKEGIRVELLQHGSVGGQSETRIIQMIRDQEEALEGLFAFVKRERPLTTFYIRELHQAVTRHQESTEARDQFGQINPVALLRGAYKIHPNNPQREDGPLFEYCPPLEVPFEMEKLVGWHLEHVAVGVSPEVEAAWLHHRFTQIHPFQDGNGRVARYLASLVLIRAGWFPLVITRDHRAEYIEALEEADSGNLQPLVTLFARLEKQKFLSALSLSGQILQKQATRRAVLDFAAEKLQMQAAQSRQARIETTRRLAETLFDHALAAMEQTRQDVTGILERHTTGYQVQLNHAKHTNDETRYYNRYQIIQTAITLNYWANLELHSSWLWFSIRINGTRTEILLSFHGVGRDYQDLMACSACVYRRISGEPGVSSEIQSLEPLSRTPFTFSSYDAPDSLVGRFQDWLKAVLDAGLAYWANRL